MDGQMGEVDKSRKNGRKKRTTQKNVISPKMRQGISVGDGLDGMTSVLFLPALAGLNKCPIPAL